MDWTITGQYTTALVTTKDLDDGCIRQIQQICDHPAFENPIAIMPDAHAGKGAVIGFTMRLGDRIVPEVVGVDIGCGMLAARLDSRWTNPKKNDRLIRSAIPMGFDVGTEKTDIALFAPWLDGINRGVEAFSRKLALPHEEVTLDTISDLLDEMGDRSWYGIGSLGGGNHFIEIGRTDGGEDWLVIHSGSRNFGLRVCEKWQTVASGGGRTKEQMREIARDIRRRSEAGLIPREEIPDRIRAAATADIHSQDGIPWLEGKNALGYLRDMLVAQVYACLNRRAMLETVLRVTGHSALETLETVHNYVSSEDPMTIRKGAVSARKDERFILPLNMTAGILLCRGKGNDQWNHSAPHGAGRKMSRTKAIQSLNPDLLARQMITSGVFTENDPKNVLDEAPDAYKPEESIVALLPPTADILERIRPIHNIKAEEQPRPRRKRRG